MPRRSLVPMMQELLKGGSRGKCHRGLADGPGLASRQLPIPRFGSVPWISLRKLPKPSYVQFSISYISFGKECVEIARAVENANDFNAGAIGKFAIENEIVSEVCDCPGTNVFVTAELPPSAQGGIASQEVKAVKNCLFNAIRRLGVVRANVGVDQVHIRDGLFGQDELNHGRDGGRQRVGAGLLRRRPPGCLCPHRVP